MPVLSVKTREASVLRNVALKFGVPVDIVDTEDGITYADLTGDPYRMLTVAIRSHAKPVAFIDNIEHHEVVRNYPARPKG